MERSNGLIDGTNEGLTMRMLKRDIPPLGEYLSFARDFLTVEM